MDNRELRLRIIQNFWNILKQTPDEFSTIKPFLDLFYSFPYDQKYFFILKEIIEEWIEREPETCISWFNSEIDKFLYYIENNKGLEEKQWISPEKILQYFACNKSLMIIEVVEKFLKLRELGVCIEKPKEVFETYKLITNTKIRRQVRKKTISFGLMKLKHISLKLEEVSWK